MEINDEERREVAQRLRERTKKPMGKSMQRMFTDTLGIYAHNNSWMNPDKATNRWDVIVNYLAGLIDRPTCETIEHGRPDEFHVCKSCSRCSYGWFEDIYDKPYSYCPNCRAEVVK